MSADRPYFVLLRRQPGQNAPSALIELTFSMDWSTDRALIFWSGTAYSVLGEHKLDSRRSAAYQESRYRDRYPLDEVKAWDLDDPLCPIEIDIERWLQQTSKFESRNPPFKMKETV